MPSRPLTAEQKADARRLRALYDKWNKEHGGGRPQDEIAESVKIKQSAFSQRLNGGLALNAKSAVIFAKLLNCKVADFSPSLAKSIEQLSTGIRDIESKDSAELLLAPASSDLDSLMQRYRSSDMETQALIRLALDDPDSPLPKSIRPSLKTMVDAVRMAIKPHLKR